MVHPSAKYPIINRVTTPNACCMLYPCKKGGLSKQCRRGHAFPCGVGRSLLLRLGKGDRRRASHGVRAGQVEHLEQVLHVQRPDAVGVD